MIGEIPMRLTHILYRVKKKYRRGWFGSLDQTRIPVFEFHLEEKDFLTYKVSLLFSAN